MYEYTAADSDEISVAEGQTLVDVEEVADGWVNATVEATGARGMMPSNFIEPLEGGGEAPAPEPEAEPEPEPEPEPEAEPEPEPEPEPEAEPEPEPEAEPEAASGEAWIALYAYDAADDDEVSFAEGERIIDVEQIDDGWVKGTVESTGASGMLPSNYIEKA